MKRPATPSRFRPGLELLEDRVTPVVVTPFTPRFAANDTGIHLLVGNTLQTAALAGNPGRTAQDVANARDGTGAFVNNNNWNMSFVDTDGDPTTFNSSRAGLVLPAGATVLFAGLYWGSVTTTPAQAATRTQVLFSTPGSTGYTPLTGELTGATNFTGVPQGSIYQGFADVTAQVQAAGAGSYGVANVQSTLQSGSYAGWALVVVVRAPGLPAKNLTVFDGFAVQASTDPPLNIPITGFIAPPSGPVTANVGVVAYEGDLGTTGDSMAVNGVRLSDAVNPANNFFNSSISNQGGPLTNKTPNYRNQLGFGIKRDSVPSGTIPNGATSATITLSTSGDGYFPGVVTFGIDLFSPDVRDTKSFTDLNGGQVLPGDVIEYTVTLNNQGQDAASNLVVTDQIPANTTYVPGSLQIVSGANAGAKTDAPGDDQAEFNGSQVVYRLGTGADATSGGNLAIGASTTIRFRVTVNATTPDGTTISNQAEASYTGATTGFDLTSNSNQVTFPVFARVNLVLTKQVNTATPNVGGVVTFTIPLINLGPVAATNVVVRDQLPDGLAFVSATTTQGTYDSATGVWAVGTLANGAGAQLVIQATVTSPNFLTNIAQATSDQLDTNPNNNVGVAIVSPRSADLVLTKAVGNARPNVGQNITYTLTLTNNGPTAATNVQVADTLPPGHTFVSATPSQGSYDSATGVWTVGTLASGATVTLRIVARVDSVLPQTNTGTASATEFDPNLDNNTDSVEVTPLRADLAITKQVSDDTPDIGQIITYTIQLQNLGPDTGTSIVVNDLLPTGVTFISATAQQGTYNNVTGNWAVGTLANGANTTLTITAQAIDTPPATNTATITNADQFDPNLDNNTASAVTSPQFVDLQLTKTANDTRPNVGDTITFTLTLTNNGPAAATGVVVSDPLPAGLQFVAATPSQGTYDPATGTWAFGSIADGASATLLLMARVVSPDPDTNVATASSNEFDPDLTNNTAQADVLPQQADLAVTKTEDNPNPEVGDPITFTVTLSDLGPDPATNVALQDVLPEGLTFVAATPSQGTYDPVTGIWTVGTVAPGAPQTLVIQAIVNGTTPQTNTATVVNSDQFDPDTTNNQDSVGEVPRRADLAVTKVPSVRRVAVGRLVTYTITVSNLGPDPATNVVLTDPLPRSLRFVSARPSLGTYQPGTRQWVIGTLAAGGVATLRLTVRVNAIGTIRNTANVTSGTFDPVLANNAAATAITAIMGLPPLSKRDLLGST